MIPSANVIPMHLTRYSMYRRISAAVAQPMRGTILGVSGIENFRPLIHPTASVIDIQYPESDLHDLKFPDQEFDWVITDQVLEHLSDPKRAVEESFRVLKIGGVAIHTTCFLNPIHGYPSDYYRFSREGLRSLCEPYGETLECGSWGNRLAAAAILLADRLRGMEIPDRPGLRRWLATRNEENYPIHVWIVARRTH
jgi:SAM-dependent methyltransferase